MDPWTAILQSHFTWGLIIGLLITFFVWKAGFTARRTVARDLKRVEDEMKNLQNHLNTQLKINASGNESLQAELGALKQQNETLRINNASLQQKPGKAEQRQLQIQEIAIRTMREQAPGFAPAWEKALRHAETEVNNAESGLAKLVRKVIPGLGNSTNAPSSAITVTEETNEHS